jgi:PAS domain S-box-containing protein
MTRENRIARLLEAITQNTPDLIYVFDLNYRFTYLNEALLKMLGRSWDECVGKSLSEVGYESWHAEMHMQEMDKVITTKKSVRGEVSFPHAKLGKRIYDYIFVPVLDSKGKVEAIAGTTRDITTQVEARKQIEESERRYNQLVHSSPTAIGILLGEDLIITEANQPIIEIWGKGKEIIGKPYFEALPELVEQGYKQVFADVYRTGKPFNAVETPVKLLQAGEMKLKYYNFLLYPQRNATNEIVGIGILATEVTSQALWNSKIKESEERYRLLADNMPMISFIVDPKPDPYISYWNKTWLDYTGQTFEEALGRSWDSIIHPDDIQGALDIYVPAFSNRQSCYIPAIRVKRHDGEYRWHLFSANPRYLPDGTFMGYIGIGFDIHEQKLTQDALKESEERFRIFSNSIQNLAWIAEGDGNIFWYNQRWLDYTGLTLEEMKGWGWQKVHHPDHVERIVEVSKKLWITNEPFELTFPLRRADGEYRWFLTRGVPITDGNGKIYRWIGTNTDIDDKINFENQLKEREEKFRSLVQTLPQLVWVTDEMGNAEFSSFRWKEYTGIEPGGENEWKAIVHPDDYDYINAAWVHSLTTGNIYSADVRLKSKAGEYRWFTVKGEPILNKENKIVKWVGAFTDVHSEKTITMELEEKVAARTIELKESEKKFYSLFNLSPICKTLTDASTGKIIMVNDAFINTFGYSREEVLNNTSAELGIIDPKLRETLVDELRTQGNFRNKEIEFVKKSGEKIFALTSAETIHITGKQYFLGAYNDITERRKAELSIAQKNIELQKLNKELQSFAYISSHDLQEPLRKIQTFASRIREKEEDNLTEHGRDYFKRMQEAAKRMQTLIQDLLTYSRTTTSERKFENTDLNEIIDEVKDDLREELNDKHATFDATELCNANIIPFQFKQLLHNLIGNALKFSNPLRPPHIKIKSEVGKGIKFNNERLSPQKKYCHISVKDNGIGFDQKYCERIFEVFQRLHGKDEYKGTGIGLSIVKKIVENHDGIITANSELDKGATFDIYIPA